MSGIGEPLMRCYFPLWAATFDSAEVGFVGGRTMAYLPLQDEWRQIHKSDVWKERWRSSGNFEGPTPPLCLVIGQSAGEEGAAQMEKELADELRAAGYTVTGGT